MDSAVGVSVMFTDLVGSTEIFARLGAAAAEALRQVHFALLRTSIRAHGGREVKNLGDGIMAVFAGVGPALDAAVAIQQACSRKNASTTGPALSIRVGVASGDCVEENGDYFGEPAIQAARLCAMADGGQILAPDVVRMLAPRGRHEFASLGELVLRGLPELVAVTELVWHAAEIERTEQLPLPARLNVTHPLRFVGRDAERQRFRDAWKAAVAGERRVVLLSGEAGLGKTRLSTELAGEVFETGALVLYGRCDEDLIAPYRPWVEALTHYVAHASDDELALHDPRSLAETAWLIPAIRDRAPCESVASSGGRDGDQYVLFGAVTTLLSAVAAVRPVMLVLDDLHWADRGTLQLLNHLVAQTSATPLLIIGTYRDTDVGIDDPLTATLISLRREPGVERVSLAGLSDVEIVVLLEATAGDDLDTDGDQLARALGAETGGNPFFVGELLRHLAESGKIAQRADGEWAATVDLDELGLPQSVREVVGARVRPLGEEARRVLAAAAVAGPDFDVAVVAGAIDLDDDRVLNVLEVAMAAGLVSEVPGAADRFTFAHALVQHALYADLSASRRARMHRRVAEAIEAQVGDDDDARVGELATHWFAAIQPAEIDRAVTYAIRAGEQAMAALAPADAVRWYGRALDAIDDRDPHRRCETMVRLGDAQRQAGDAAHRQCLLDAADLARRLDRDDLLVAAALANSRGWHSNSWSVDRERVSALEAALGTTGVDSRHEHALLLATLAAELSYSGEPRYIDFARAAIASARRAGESDLILETLLRASDAFVVPELFAEFCQLSEEVMELTRERPNSMDRVRALDVDFAVLLMQGNMSAARSSLAERVNILDRLRQPTWVWDTMCHEALISVITCNTGEMERLNDEALHLGLETGQPDAMLYYGGLLVCIRWLQGRDAELTDLMVEIAADNPDLVILRAILGFHHAWQGDFDRARPVFDALAAGDFRFPWDGSWLASNVVVAETAYLLGDTTAARLLYERLVPYRDLVAATGITCVGSVAHVLGCLAITLGRDEAAELHLTEALERHQRLEAPFFRALTMLEMAKLVHAREPERARALLDDTLVLADTHLMASIREQTLVALHR